MHVLVPNHQPQMFWDHADNERAHWSYFTENREDFIRRDRKDTMQFRCKVVVGNIYPRADIGRSLSLSKSYWNKRWPERWRISTDCSDNNSASTYDYIDKHCSRTIHYHPFTIRGLAGPLTRRVLRL